MYTYDPKDASLIVGGFAMSGFADGTFISVERTSDAFSKVTGADGITSRAKSNDKSGTITITLAQTSPSNDILSGFAILDESKNAGVVPASLLDFAGKTVAASAFAWVKKSPKADYSKEVGNREWVLDCADLDLFIGGSDSV